MPWFVPQWSESIKKRLCRYLLQRYLGQFLEEKLTLDQLTIDLYNGKGIVKDVSLDVNALNELAEQQSMPVWFVRGSVATVSVSIPWSTLLSDASYVEVCGLHVTVQPKVREENCASMLESMWNSLSSSMQLAEECLKQEALDIDVGGASLEGLELFAQTIDSILSRVKVRFIDTTLRLEHVPEGSLVGVALEIKIDQMTYLDEAGMDEPNLEEESGRYQVSAFTTKKFSLEAVKFYTDEFKACDFTTEFEDRESLGQHSKIWAAQLAGRQEVRLQMKQSENIRGPKVSLEILMGSLTIFLSPRQLHGLLALAGGLTSPSGPENQQSQGRQKPMEARDFHLVEQDLQHRLTPANMPSPQRLNHGWSAAAGESDDDDEFLPMKGGRSGMVDSMASSTDSMASSMTASTVSSVSSFAHKCLAAGMPSKEPRKKSRRRVAQEESWSTDTTTFAVRGSSMAVVLLQEDILVCQSNITEASTRQLSDTVAAFFASLGDLASVGFGVKDFERARQVFSNACSKNHLRLLAAPVMIEGTERAGSTGHMTEGSMTMARLEVLEVLPEQPGQDSDLLKFKGPPAGAPLSLTPDLQLKFSHSQKHTPPKHFLAAPRTNLALRLQACLVEVDISLMDRVSALLNPPSWVTPSKVSRDTWHEAVENSASTESFLDLALLCPLLTVKLRFPRADLRPLSDMMRTPYWVRSVHPDWLLLELSDAALTCKVDSSDPTTHIELSGRNLTLFFQQEEEHRVQLLTANAEEAGQSLPGGGADFGLLRAVLTVHPVATPSDLVEPVGCDTDDTDDNLNTLESEARAREPSPFSAKRVVHESDTPHGTSAGVTDCAADELLIPGDKREMAEFIELASLRSRVHLDLCLPSGRLTMPSKHLYELVYNRLSTDLLLWEPARPNNPDTNNEPSLSPSAFAMCKSSLNLYSDSDSSSDSEGVFHSVHEQRQRHRRQQVVTRHSGQSLFTLVLNLGQGIISLCTPLRDLTGCVIPNQRGDLRLHVVEGSLFLVSSHRGDPSVSYVCVQANQASLHHCGLVPADVEDVAVLPTIVQTGSGTVVRTGIDPVGTGAHSSLDMLTVAVRIHMDEPNSLKMIRVAAGVRGATLLHRVMPGPQTWLSQMIDMLDVLDFPVPGYTPPRVLTELHLHLWDCAIDYRPVNLPVRAAVTLGSFAISSNLAAATRSSSLRFIAEECAFFLSPRKVPGPAELKRDYVCVLELGLFELALRLSEDPRAPKVDLRASTTAVHVRTCADSCRTLMELITYFASDGDLVEPRATTPAPTSTSQQQGSQQPCHAELVPNMMEEAMQDTGMTSTAETTHSKENEVEDEAFCFPGDAVRKNSEDDDEEFCILGEDPGTGIMPASGQPEVRRLVTGPLCVSENHFAVPLGRSDPLQAPPHYPVPNLRYTLCDLALVWYIYGGCDFENTKRHVTYMQDVPQTWDAHVQGSSTVEFSKNNPHEVHFCGSAKSSPVRRPSPAQLSWQARGGSRRDHNTLMELHLNKVRFLHETYPDSANVASRQVLLVQSLEVRDRLASSAINKFLYMHCTEAQPRQAHAYMVTVKALHERPDLSLPSQQECCLRLSLLPLRLNIDQDALLFLCNFFAELGASTSVAEAEVEVPRTPPAHAPVMSVQGTTSVRPPLEQLLPTLRSAEDEVQGSPPVFFRTLLFSPDVLVRVDYQGKRVDMTHGPLAGLLMGLAQLNCSELKLKRLAYRHGLLGVDKLMSYMLGEWLTDIKKNQLPSVLGGVGPMHSFVQLFQGVRDLVLLPIEQYQRDGRLVRGLQRGAHSFTSSTAMAALELTNRLVHAVQVTAETAYDMLSPGPSVRQRRLFGPTSRSRRLRARYSQPADIREGVANAYHLVQEGLGETAWNLVAVASAEHEEKGMYGAVGGVLRQIPPTVVTPILLGAEAASSVLGGVRSQLAPDVRREAAQKWRTQSPQ